MDERKYLDLLGYAEFSAALFALWTGDLQVASDSYQAGLELLKKAPKTMPLPRRFVSQCIFLETELGELAQKSGDYDEAMDHYELNLFLWEQRRDLEGDSKQVLSGLGGAHTRLGDVAKALGRLDEAHTHLMSSLELEERIRTEYGGNLLSLRHTHRRLGELARERDKPEDAMEHYAAMLELIAHPDDVQEDSERLLIDTRLAHRELGSLAHERRQFDYAEVHLLAALRLSEQEGKQEGDAPEVLANLSWDHSRLGHLARQRGRLEEAHAHYAAALRLAEQVRTFERDTHEDLLNVISMLHSVGQMDRDLGRLDNSQAHFMAALTLSEQVLAADDNLQAVRAMGLSYLGLGDVALHRGRVDEAHAHYAAALRMAERFHTLDGDTVVALGALRGCLATLGDVALHRGQPGQAQLHFASSLRFAEQIGDLKGDDISAKLDIASVLLRLGAAVEELGQHDQAHAHFTASRELLERACSKVDIEPDLLELIYLCLSYLGDLAKVRNRLDEAHSFYTESLIAAEQVVEWRGKIPRPLRHVSLSLSDLAKLARQRGDATLATSYALRASELSIDAAVSGAELTLDDLASSAGRLRRLARSELSNTSVLWPLYERMLPFVSSYGEFNDPQSLERARPHIERFHNAWLATALYSSPERLPAVLGSAQGRKITALAMHEFHRQAHSEAVHKVPQFARYLAAREHVNQLSLALGGGARAGSAFGDLPGMTAEHKVESAEVIRARTQTLWAEHRAALAEHEAARAALIDVRPELADLAPASTDRYTLASLHRGLTPDSALLLLLMAPVEDDEDLPKRPHRAHALLIRNEGPPRLWALPELDRLPGQIHAWRQAQASGHRTMDGAMTYRDCQGRQRGLDAGADGDADATLPAAELIDSEQALHQRLWSVLQDPDGRDGPSSCLAGVTQLHVVSHGQLHGLPLTLGAPQGIAISQYPGLVNYWLVTQDSQQTALTLNALQRLQMQVYSPEAGTGEQEALGRIPYVQAEAHLVGRCWARHDELLQREPLSEPATVLHLACHGTLQRQGQEDPCLILSPKDSVNLIELLQRAPSAPIVYLSACLVGRTREDGDGDPLGLVSGFFLRGARCVIAALNPISDFHAPLLAYMFHRSLQAQAQYQGLLRPVQALADAKRQLQSGHWVPEQVPANQRDRWEHNSVLAVQQDYGAQIQHELRQDVGQSPLEDWGWQIRDRIDQWGMGQLLGGELGRLSRDMRDALKANEQGEKAAGPLLAQRLVQARTRLYEVLTPLQWLLQDVQAFGATGRVQT